MKMGTKKQLCSAMFAACLLAGGFSLPAAYAEETTAPIAQGSAPAKEGVSRGLLMQYKGKTIFAPCRERTYVQLEDVSDNEAISAALLKFGLREDRPLYVEFFGVADNGKLKAKWLNFADRNARCQATANLEQRWRAVGADPRWGLRLESTILTLEQAGQDAVEYPSVRARMEGQNAQLHREGENDPLWSFQRQLCQLPGVDILFGWRATSHHAKHELHGCAWQGYE